MTSQPGAVKAPSDSFEKDIERDAVSNHSVPSTTHSVASSSRASSARSLGSSKRSHPVQNQQLRNLPSNAVESEDSESNEHEEEEGWVLSPNAGVNRGFNWPEMDIISSGEKEDDDVSFKLKTKERIRHFTWTWFCMTMATGGIANVLNSGICDPVQRTQQPNLFSFTNAELSPGD